jgi:hypothetical protein
MCQPNKVPGDTNLKFYVRCHAMRHFARSRVVPDVCLRDGR